MTEKNRPASPFRDVPTKVDFVALEHRALAFWRDERCFEKLVEQNRGKPAWSFLDGPITANNPMGVHHAWGRSYKDMFCRYHAMTGHELRYQNGFDCQGLWVEVEVEKELGFKSKRDIEDYGIAAFVEKCKERVARFADVQTKQSVRLGYWMDWDDSYYTMSDRNNYTIWAFLKKCHQKGWVAKGTDVMPWCGRCGTGLSQHEIATEGYREMTHVSPYVRFPLVGEEGASLLVWTTTPWTLGSNVAAAVHPDKTYLKVRQGGDVYYVIAAREKILKEKGPYEVVDRVPGSSLVGREYRAPFEELPAQKGVVHKVIAWDEVSEDDGTGVVHIAPGCGKEDFELSKQYGLAVIAPLDELGNFVEGFGDLTGKNASEVWPEVIERLKEKKLLYKQEHYKHNYPVCWRCGRELLFRLVDEWFIRMGGRPGAPAPPPDERAGQLRYQIMDVVQDSIWFPAWGKQQELDWLHNMGDWMISKKRYWGLALPIFVCTKCGEFDVIGGKDELKARAVSGWGEFEGHSPHRPYVDGVKIGCAKCGGVAERVRDVGNPWLDAGIVAFSTMKWGEDDAYFERWFPADLVTESFPGQFRNWFYSLLAMSTVMAGRSPFKTLFGYASMRAQDGREMHKSWGNSIEFNEAADKAGVDAMRWLFAGHVPDQNLLFGFEAVDEARRKFLTLWNVYSFFVTYARVDGFDPSQPAVPYADRSVFDRWIIGSLHELIKAAREGFEGYRVFGFMRQLEQFLDRLSTWYVRRSRRRFWKSEDDGDKRAAYQTLYEVLVTLTEILAPICPFATEEMYQNLVRSADKGAALSVHHRAFPVARMELVDHDLNRAMALVLDVVELARNARQKANLKVRQPLAKMIVALPKATPSSALAPFVDQVLDELNIKSLEFRDDVSGLLRVSAKLDIKKAGPRLGKLAQKTLAAFRALPASELASMGGKNVTVQVDGAPVEVLADEIAVDRAAVEGWALASSGDLVVLVDTEVSAALKHEGIARDLIRAVQDLRKSTGLDVSDRIVLTVEARGAVRAAAETHLETIKRETLAIDVVFGAASSGGASVNIDAEPVALSLATAP